MALIGGNRAGNFSIEVSDRFPLVISKIAGIAVKGDLWGRETMIRAGRVAATAMGVVAPHGERAEMPEASPSTRAWHRRFPPLRERVTFEREPKFFPGGAGGGGYWQGMFGVRPYGYRPLEHDPAFIYVHGSGIRADAEGRRASSFGGRPITSRSGNIMAFIDQGAPVYTKKFGGQRAHPEFVEAGRIAAKIEVRRRIAELNRELL
jgi:hypothetical protein